MVTTKYSASDALEMMKSEFPNDYQERIDIGKQLIIRLKKMYNKETYTEAYQRYINSGCSDESHIMMLCALQQLNDEQKQATEAYKNSILGMHETRDNLLSQQAHNEESTTTLEVDKKILRQFYRTKIDEITKQIQQYTNAIEVVDAVIVYTPNLFSQPISA